MAHGRRRLPLRPLARRRPGLDGRVPHRSFSHPRQRPAVAELRASVARARRTGAGDCCGRHTGDRLARRVARRRGDRARKTGDRIEHQGRDRPSHRRYERLQPRAGGGDRARHRALPRRRQRLERHRLQLSRRPVRHDLRGPRRWSRPERRRRPCAGVQRRDGRRGADRQLQCDDADQGAAGRPGEAARLAPRRRPRRSEVARPLHLGWQLQVSRGPGRHAACDLRAPRYRTDRVSRGAGVRAAPRADPTCRRDRPAEAVRPRGGGGARGQGPLSRPALLDPSLDGDGHRPPRRHGRLGRRARLARRLDVELGRRDNGARTRGRSRRPASGRPWDVSARPRRSPCRCSA